MTSFLSIVILTNINLLSDGINASSKSVFVGLLLNDSDICSKVGVSAWTFSCINNSTITVNVNIPFIIFFIFFYPYTTLYIILQL